RLKKIASLDLQKQLLEHLDKYSTIKIPLIEARNFIQGAVEYNEFCNVCNEDQQFDTVESFIDYLISNDFEYKKSKFQFVNVFVTYIKDKLDISHFEIKENFNLAFSASGIEELNKGRSVPIKKVKLFERSEGRYSLGNKLGNRHKMLKC